MGGSSKKWERERKKKEKSEEREKLDKCKVMETKLLVGFIQHCRPGISLGTWHECCHLVLTVTLRR